MTTIEQRYSTAIRSRDTSVKAKTIRSDSDVLGAMALADRTLTRGHDSHGNPVPPCELAVPLTRLLAGDNHAVHQVVAILGREAHHYSFVLHVRISRVECDDMARAAITWFRDGRCKDCGGHGKLLIPNTRCLGNEDCPTCRGAGVRPFEHAFPRKRRVLAAWLIEEMDRALGRAGPQAMEHLAPQFLIDKPEKT